MYLYWTNRGEQIKMSKPVTAEQKKKLDKAFLVVLEFSSQIREHMTSQGISDRAFGNVRDAVSSIVASDDDE